MKRRLQWFDHAQEIKEIAWSRICRNFKVSGSCPRGIPRRTWNEVIKRDLNKHWKEMLGRKNLSNPYKHGKQT